LIKAWLSAKKVPDDITAIGVSPIQFMGAFSQFLQQEYDFSLDNH